MLNIFYLLPPLGLTLMAIVHTSNSENQMVIVLIVFYLYVTLKIIYKFFATADKAQGWSVFATITKPSVVMHKIRLSIAQNSSLIK